MSTVGPTSEAAGCVQLQRLQGQARSGAIGQPRKGHPSFEARLDAAAQNAGLDSTQVSKLHTDIQEAVNSALKGASAEGNKRAAIKDAINSVLKKYGIDPTSMKPRHTGHAHGAHRHHGAGKCGHGHDSEDDGDGDDGTAAPADPTQHTIATLLQDLPSGSLMDAAA